MFSVADFLDRAKARSSIVSDYQLAKVIGKNHSVITNYRTGISLPNEQIIEQLCALTGDDPDLIAAQVQAARSRDEPARAIWTRIAARLSGAATTAILSVCFTISLIASSASDARATTLYAYKTGGVTLLYIVSTGVFVRLARLRQRARGLPGFFWLCWRCCC